MLSVQEAMWGPSGRPRPPAPPGLSGLEWGPRPHGNGPPGCIWIYSLSGLGQVRTPEENHSPLLLTWDENDGQASWKHGGATWELGKDAAGARISLGSGSRSSKPPRPGQ